MNAFFGGTKSTKRTQETHQSEVERLRGRQLASLVRAGAKAKNLQQTTFEVFVADTSRGKLVVTISLPDGFPTTPPDTTVSIPFQHAWVDVNGNVTGHPDLRNWTVHSDLGRIVSEIVSEARRAATLANTFNPPPMAAHASPSSTSASTSNSMYPGASGQSYFPHSPSIQAQTSGMAQPMAPLPPPIKQPNKEKSSQPQQPCIPTTPLPPTPTVFPELEELTTSQLQKLVDDKHELKKFCKQLDAVQDFMKLRESVLEGNIKLANQTLQHDAALKAKRKEVEELRQALRKAQEQLAAKQARQQQLVSQFRPDALLDQVSSAAKQADADSDEIAHQFTDGDMTFATFISSYLPLRKAYHQRTIKFNKLMQQ